MSRAASSSRVAPARRRARLLKVASAGAAVVGFGVLSVIVRGGTHANGATVTPTTTGTSGSLALSSRISEEASQPSSSFFGSGSVAPSQSSSSQPQATTHSS